MNQNKDQPIPQGRYLPPVRDKDLIFTSGMTPRIAVKLIYSRQIKSADPIEFYRDAVQLAILNALIAVQECMGENERIAIILQLNVFLNTEGSFEAHSKIADFTSEMCTRCFTPLK